MIVSSVFILFLLIGSFLNVLIYRIPREEDVVVKRSNCPKCKKLISWKENIPIFSYLFLFGKCKNCKEKISIKYPFIELLTAVLGSFVYLKYFEIDQLKMIMFSVVICLFIVQFFIDLEHYILPHSLNLIIGACLLVIAIRDYSWQHYIFGFIIGFVPLFLLGYLYEKYRGQIGLGGGDIVLFGMLGIYLGPFKILYTIIFSSLLGTLVILALMAIGKVSDKEVPVPFGPSILIISSIQLFYPGVLESLFLKIV